MSEMSREITDSRVLAAMSHPARRRLLDALTVDGPGTVSMLAQRTDQAVGNVSHHIKILAAAGLVAAAPELARDQREHWWRMVDRTLRWSSTSFQDSAAEAVVADAATSMNLEHHAAKVREWNARREFDAGGWTTAAFSSDAWLHLSPAELTELSVEMTEVMSRWRHRQVPDDGVERGAVFVFAHGVPARP